MILLAWVLATITSRTPVNMRHEPAPPPPDAAPALAVAPFDAEQAKAHQDAWAKHLGVPVEITNSIGMKLRLIPPGTNALGASGPAGSTEAFFIGTTEVTVEQFRRFIEDAKYKTMGEANKLGGMLVQAGKKTERGRAYVWSHPDFARSPSHPVTLVTWHDAIEFCEWLSRKEKHTYRLPTLEEWRWAERAGSDSRFYFGQGSSALDTHAWVSGNSEVHTHPVGGKLPNPWGLFDAYGNVWELSYDWRRNERQVEPMLRKVGPGNSDRFIMCGGAYGSSPDEVLETAFGPALVGYSHLGFRVTLVGKLNAPAPRGRPDPPMPPMPPDPSTPPTTGRSETANGSGRHAVALQIHPAAAAEENAATD
jgi:formylglycine-generating enzyme required for sulfatase activity